MIITEADLGCPAFILAVIIINSGFLLWGKLQARVHFYETESKNIVRQACANVIDASVDAKAKSEKLLEDVDKWFRLLRKCSLFLIELAVFSGLFTLYMGWSGNSALLGMGPVCLYITLSWLFYRVFITKSDNLMRSNSSMQRDMLTAGKGSVQEAEPLHAVQALICEMQDKMAENSRQSER